MAIDYYLPMKMLSGAFTRDAFRESGVEDSLRRYEEAQALRDRKRIAEEDRQRRIKKEQSAEERRAGLSQAVSEELGKDQTSYIDLGRAVAPFDPSAALGIAGQGLKPDKSRKEQIFKIQSAINSAQSKQAALIAANMPDEAEKMDVLINEMKKEMSAESPDIQQAYIRANVVPGEEERKVPGDVGMKEQGTPQDWLEMKLDEFEGVDHQKTETGGLKNKSKHKRKMKAEARKAGFGEVLNKMIDASIDEIDTDLRSEWRSGVEAGEAGRKAKRERLGLEKQEFETTLRTNYPTLEKERESLNKIYTKFRGAISSAQTNPTGGSYLFLKGQLGDALSADDLKGLAGYGLDAGWLADLKKTLGGSPLDEKRAKEIITDAIKGYNGMVEELESRIMSRGGDVSSEMKAQIKDAYVPDEIQVPDFGKEKSTQKDEKSVEMPRSTGVTFTGWN